MMKRRVLVKQLSAIEDFGSIDILCSDKTGTLTEGEIVLDRRGHRRTRRRQRPSFRVSEQFLRSGHQD